MKALYILFSIILGGCTTGGWVLPPDIRQQTISTPNFDILTYHRLTDNTSPIHIYIEGDGNSFDAYGIPRSDPTPRGTFMRDLMAQDTSANAAYIARPCQYIQSEQCDISDWTSGRFSPEIIDSVSYVIQEIAQNRDIILIGYSGGAMVSGLVISQHPEMKIKKWITIAGVLNHHDWTEYFNDAPLTESVDLIALPDVSQIHYVADSDSVIPNELSKKWTHEKNLIFIENATHHKFPGLILDFD